jgi:ElaB/YqjD/DUF883 family membrane-anchored ribosome-binding protein
MDDQPLRDIGKDKATMQRALVDAEAEGTAASRTIAGIASATIDDARTMVRDVGERVNEAATMARNAGEQAWTLASDAGSAAQELARQARDQAAAASDTLFQATDTLYQEGARASVYLRRNVEEHPLTALLISGAIGYLAAYLIHASWQASNRLKGKVSGPVAGSQPPAKRSRARNTAPEATK